MSAGAVAYPEPRRVRRVEELRAAVIIIFVLASLGLWGCSSRAARVGPRPPASYQALGPARGSACGVMLFDFIPINVTARTERAYRRALTAAPGAAMLIDTRVRDRWYSLGGILLGGHIVCADIVGTAIK